MAKKRLIAGLLTRDLPKDPVGAAANTTAALVLAAIPDGASSEVNAMSVVSTTIRSEIRRVLEPAAATAP